MSDKQEKKLTGYPSIDKPWLKYYSEEAVSAPLPECTVYENIWQHNKDHLDDIALEYYGHKTSYRKLFAETERAAKALRAAGVKCGDCVALCTAGVPEAVHLVLACSRIGAVANFINPMFSEDQMVGRINDTGADLLLVLDAMYKYIADAVDKTCAKRIVSIPIAGSLSVPARIIAALKSKPDKRLRDAMKGLEKYTYWREFVSGADGYAGAIDEPYEKDRPTVMVYSSGTTGASKGIQLTNDGINATITQYKYMTTELSRQMSFLHFIPCWFSTGIVVCLLMPLCLDMRVILEPDFGIEQFAADLIRYKPNFAFSITSHWLYAAKNRSMENISLDFLAYPISGGEALTAKSEQQINRFIFARSGSVRLATGWGMCELGATVTATTTTTLTRNPELRRPGSSGIPIPLAAVAAFDAETGRELPYGERGELRAMTPSRMLGYYKNPEATAEFFKTDAQGRVWGCTGDMGYVDSNGLVYVLGRMTDCCRAENGETVYLFDVENVILQEEAVEQCKTVDIVIDGKTVPAAHLVLSDGCNESVGEIIRRLNALCRKELPEYAVPRAYKLRRSFPAKPSGKQDADALRNERDGYVDADGKDISL